MMAGMRSGAWARANGMDTGRIVRLAEYNARTDSWLCDVIDLGDGRTLYQTDIRARLLEVIEGVREPLLFFTLETLAGSRRPS